MAKQKYDLYSLRIERTKWEIIPTDEMDDETRAAYLKRKKAVDMYIDGYKNSEIKEGAGNAVYNVLRLIEKCLQTEPYGNSLGYRALVPNMTVKKYTPNPGSKTKGGSFETLLANYPELNELIVGCVKNDPKYVANRNMQIVEIHKVFLRECTRLGIQDISYPFNTKTKALRSLERYVKKLRETDVEVSMAWMNKDARQRHKHTSFLKKITPEPCFPYSKIHVDGHKLDIVYVVKVDDGDGLFHYDIAMRPWVFAVIEVTTVTVLGYYLTQNEEYDQTDVMKAIMHAILPKKQYTLEKDSVLRYPANGGWPDTAYPCLEYALWDNIMMDNALAHQAKVLVTLKFTGAQTRIHQHTHALQF